MNPVINEFRKSANLFITFLKNPVQEIRRLPNWPWKHLLMAQALITMGTGILGGMAALSPLSILSQAISVPILTFIMLSVSCFFFYYAFQIFANKTVSFRSLFTTVFFANLPFFIFQIGSYYFPPILLIGLAFTALLLIVAFVENYQMPKKLAIRLIGSLYIIFLIIWIAGRIDGSRIDKTWKSPRAESSAPEVHLGQ